MLLIEHSIEEIPLLVFNSVHIDRGYIGRVLDVVRYLRERAVCLNGIEIVCVANVEPASKVKGMAFGIEIEQSIVAEIYR